MKAEPHNISIIGCNGSIGAALTKNVSERYTNAITHAFSRHKPENIIPDVTYHSINYEDETSIEKAADKVAIEKPIDIAIVTIGILHDNEILPEKSLKELSAKKFKHLFEVNAILPAIVAKYFLPKLNKEKPSVFAILSARVGSISDNRLGGWYAYRASKAALNMIIKTAAIETERYNEQSIVVGLHPGTVDSNLSKPFQRNVPEDKLFTPDYSAKKLLEVIENLKAKDSGKCFAWDGKQILP